MKRPQNNVGPIVRPSAWPACQNIVSWNGVISLELKKKQVLRFAQDDKTSGEDKADSRSLATFGIRNQW